MEYHGPRSEKMGDTALLVGPYIHYDGEGNLYWLHKTSKQVLYTTPDGYVDKVNDHERFGYFIVDGWMKRKRFEIEVKNQKLLRLGTLSATEPLKVTSKASEIVVAKPPQREVLLSTIRDLAISKTLEITGKELAIAAGISLGSIPYLLKQLEQSSEIKYFGVPRKGYSIVVR